MIMRQMPHLQTKYKTQALQNEKDLKCILPISNYNS